MKGEFIKIKGARVHNLKNVSLDIPKGKLVVITGLSGSGKSSLAFDTIYAEGQRRYVESLSAYARQFLGVMDKPDVDSIDGLSPAIAIDQRSVSKNPRSTVGTITEIYDYMRLLFSRVGKPYCPECGKIISRQSPSAVAEAVLKYPAGAQITILGPLVRAKKGEHHGILEQAQKAGFVNVRVDGIVHRLEEAMGLELDKQKKHSIEVVVDRVEVPSAADKDERARIVDSIETALKVGKGMMIVSKNQDSGSRVKPGTTSFLKNDVVFSELFACEKCGISLPEIEPRLFSFNSPFGACPECQGLGSKLEIDPKLVMPNPRLTLAEGVIRPWATASHRVGRQGYYYWLISKLAEANEFSLNTPAGELPKDVVKKILYGDSKNDYEGVIPNLERRWKETDSDFARAEIEKYMQVRQCPLCHGARLKREALAIRINSLNPPGPPFKRGVGGLNIADVSAMSIEAAKKYFEDLKLSANDAEIAKPVVKEILKRLKFLLDVGLDYLTIGRESTTLSGGEAQRIRLATQIGSGLSGVVYILDEPSIGLHQRDLARLIATLFQLRDLGNTVIVVEHDEQTILAADWIVDVGPGAGIHGGKIIFAGTPAQLLKSDCLTGQYLSGKKSVSSGGHPDPAAAGSGSKKDSSASGLRMTDKNKEHLWGEPGSRVKPGMTKSSGSLQIIGATEHNLKNIDVKIPLQKFVAVTGVSGSGKSTLVNDILGKSLSRDFHGAHQQPGAHKEIFGTDNLDKVIIVDQSPIGRTPRSNPATYTGIFTPIRDIFSQTQEAKIRGYSAGRFSFNVKGGRCENCEGDGVKKIEMYFLPDVYIECEVCHGQRYNKETLEIEYKGKNIAQILAMPVEEGYDFFKNLPALEQKLRTLKEVGLGYMKLGQSSTTLSGGEAQRIKLATELARRDTGNTLYILDEPTTGLHFDDIRRLLTVLRELVKRGNSVLVIEHNLDVIASTDWVIDLGPEGGEKGGYVVAQGTVEEIIKSKKSYTGKYLKE
ncbi:MAG: excinuclease ABC subunit UvrA [Candidatus Portnoybacteria bacterium]|nr:excinuclease ABC subunit UvrA [Candidatus Portnoybacteria bacterium]MDD4983182.1 excinuclease ABC subunit UvrA [Candidatus Portnoybacteria bacterium]